MQPKRYSVVLVGNSGSGKTSFLKRILSGQFEKHYKPTIGVEVRPIRFRETNIFDVWDTAGRENFMGLLDGYLMNKQGGIVMYDANSRTYQKEIEYWTENIRRMSPYIPIVYVENKVDTIEVEEQESRIGKPGYKISVISNRNLMDPFRSLLEELS